MCFYFICFFFILSSRFCVTNLLQIYFKFFFRCSFRVFLSDMYFVLLSLQLVAILYLWCMRSMFVSFQTCSHYSSADFFPLFRCCCCFYFIYFFFGFTFTPHKFALSNFPTSSLSQNINVCMWSGVVFVWICGG